MNEEIGELAEEIPEKDVRGRYEVVISDTFGVVASMDDSELAAMNDMFYSPAFQKFMEWLSQVEDNCLNIIIKKQECDPDDYRMFGAYALWRDISDFVGYTDVLMTKKEEKK